MDTWGCNMARHVRFISQDLELEGLLSEKSSTSVAIVTHPHPLYGGDMHNAVVETIHRAYDANGWSTLRFNFRGTGHSDGAFDNGVGEQTDLDAAIGFLKSKKMTDIELAGYSFGAWVMACWAGKEDNQHMSMRFIAPPVGFIDFNPVLPIQGLRQVILGSNDDFAPQTQCGALASQWNPEANFDVIQNTDHFFWNQMDTLQQRLEENISQKNS